MKENEQFVELQNDQKKKDKKTLQWGPRHDPKKKKKKREAMAMN